MGVGKGCHNDRGEEEMNILCRLRLHRWAYRARWSVFPITKNVTRYCERCERIERGIILIGSIFPPTFEEVHK